MLKTINAYHAIQANSYLQMIALAHATMELILTQTNVYNAHKNVQHAIPSINVHYVTTVITNSITNV